MLTVRRILEEKLTKGTRMFVMSIDLMKVFDIINYQAVPTILENTAIPFDLINKITIVK